MDAMKHVEEAIIASKPKIIATFGNADAAVTDDGLRKMADLLHGQLPFAVRIVIKKDLIANLLVTSRVRVRSLLAGV